MAGTPESVEWSCPKCECKRPHSHCQRVRKGAFVDTELPAPDFVCDKPTRRLGERYCLLCGL